MRSFSRSGAILSLVLGFVFVLIGAAQAATISVSAYAQEQGNWCWAASTRTIVGWRTGITPPSQCQLVKWGKAQSTCPNVTGSFISDINRAYTGAGLWGGNTANYLASNTAIRYQIDNWSLVQVRIGWASSGGESGHVLTVYGYSSTSTINWIDPAGGVRKSGSWSYLSSNSSWTATHSRWFY